MFYSAVYPSPLGVLTPVCDESGEALVGLWIEGQRYWGRSLPEQPMAAEDRPILRRTKEWLDRYFAGERPESAELRLAPIGSDFRQEVWALLRQIPYGQVTTYGALGEKIARSHSRSQWSAQAIGGAVGQNPISLIIPCHRVVGSDGSLRGYAGGVEKKLWLLEHERAGAIRTGPSQ